MHTVARKRAQARAHAQYTFHRRLATLTKKGLIQLSEEKDGTYARLTDPGKSELAFLVVHSKKPTIWDGKWRVLMFDIPNTNSQLREELRGLIKRIGYVALQQSVYVFPYDIPELTTLLTEKNLPLSQIAHSTIDSLPRDTALRKHFKLSPTA
jgi:phenylacetic acid degradation operon negative regulatory protein